MVILNDLTPEELAEQIKKTVQENCPLIVRTHTFSHSMELYVEQLLTLFLEEVRQDYIKDYVIYFVKELMVNAKKANTKRVYFIEQGLDINDMDDYREGMKHFKKRTFDNITYYLTLQKEKGLFVELHINKKRDDIVIEVWNNAEITSIEKIRIMNKLKTGEKYANLEDVMSETVDDMEGSGLGLIILVLMMKKMGVKQERRKIRIARREGNTVIGVKIPLKM
jgi:hypothetical protein